MPFPKREYLTLEEVAKRWGIDVPQVRYSIYHDKLEACCWFDRRKVDYYEFEEASPYNHSFSGYAGIYEHDCRRIFRPGDALISSFYILDGGGAWFRIPKNIKAALIHPGEVFVRLSACRTFEKRFDLVPAYEATLLIGNKGRELYYNGEPLHFGALQEQVIRLLGDAAKKNKPWVDGRILLERVGSQAPRLRDLFKGNAAWKELIQSDRHGHYRLYEHLLIQYGSTLEEAA